MADYFIRSGVAVPYANQAWALGQRMVPTVADATANASLARGYAWEVTTAGTSTATPAWAASVTVGTTTVTQNGVVWTARSPTTWADALPYFAYIPRISSLGANDRVWIADDHNESYPASFNPSSAFAPIVCVDHTKNPPYAVGDLRTTAIVNVPGASTFTLQGQRPLYGVHFVSSSGAANSQSMQISAAQGLEFKIYNCEFSNLSTGGTPAHFLLGGASAPGVLELNNCTLNQGTAQTAGTAMILFAAGGSRTKIRCGGASLFSGGCVAPALLISGGSQGSTVVLDGCDLSLMASGSALLLFSGQGVNLFQFVNCKLGAGVNTFSATPAATVGTIAEIHDSSDTSLNYRFERSDARASLTTDTVVVRAGGASDGTTPFSWRVQTNSGADRIMAFDVPPLSQWIETVGSKTVALALLSKAPLDSGTASIEVAYLGSAATPVASLDTTSGLFPVLPTGAALTADTSAWDGAAGLAARADNTAYALNAVIKLASNPGRVFICTTAGTSTTGAPAGYASAVDGSTVTDGTAVFQAMYRYVLQPTAPITVNMKGYVRVLAKIGASSTIVYVDPYLQIS